MDNGTRSEVVAVFNLPEPALVTSPNADRFFAKATASFSLEGRKTLAESARRIIGREEDGLAAEGWTECEDRVRV